MLTVSRRRSGGASIGSGHRPGRACASACGTVDGTLAVDQPARRPDRRHRIRLAPGDRSDEGRHRRGQRDPARRAGGNCSIDRGHTVVAAVADGDALRAAVAADPPDVCVVDIRMPPSFTDEGLRAALALRRSHPDVGVLVFSQYVETRYAAELLAGSTRGVGYLLKDRVADVREFVEALQSGSVRRRDGARPRGGLATARRVAPPAGAGDADAARARRARADGRRAVQRRDRARRWSSPTVPSRSTSPTSSPSSICRRPRPTTGACWPSCAT